MLNKYSLKFFIIKIECHKRVKLLLFINSKLKIPGKSSEKIDKNCKKYTRILIIFNYRNI